MKKFTKHVLALFMMGLCFSSFAQQDVKITKTIKEEEKVLHTEIEEMKLELKEMQTMLSELQLDDFDGKDVEFTIELEDSDASKEEIMFYRAAKGSGVDDELSSFTLFLGNDEGTKEADPQPKKKTFLGVTSTMTSEGLQLTSIIDNTAASKAGLKQGDVLLTFDDVKMGSHSALTNAIRSKKEGDKVPVTYIREGQTNTTMVTMGTKTIRPHSNHHWTNRNYNYTKVERDPCQVFIGVTTGTHRSQTGVRISEIIPDTPAEEAGLQAGDIITSIDGMATYSYSDLRVERDKHEQGDEFAIAYIRDGVAQNVVAQFKSCETEEEVVEETVEIVEPIVEDLPALPIDYTLEVADLKVFPNPTYGKLTIQFEAEAVPTTVRITDVAGKLVFVDQLPRFDGYYQNEINIGNDAAPGMMNITIQQGDKVKGEKAILLPKA